MRLSSTLILLAIAAACLGCDAATYREGCHAYCLTDDTGLPPNRVRCLDENAFTCMGGFARCADGTSVEPSICTDDGPRCADGSEPVCDGTASVDGG
jgi:hypothetical protein